MFQSLVMSDSWNLISNAIFGEFFCKLAKMSSTVLNHVVIDVLSEVRPKVRALSLAMLDELKA
jgi:hypothetical protein